MLRRALPLLGALLIFPLSAGASSPEEFVRETGARVFSSLGEEGLDTTEHTRRFRSLLNEAFDLPAITRFVLGRYWRTTSDEEKTEFASLFEKFLVKAYANRFRDLGDKKLKVLRSQELTGGQTLVMSEIDAEGSKPVKVNWRIRGAGQEFKITDVLVEGVSMSVTQRDEFASVIRQGGGRIDGLLRILRKKTRR